ncbi:uncharacterized protein LOC142950116 [Anarhichas minor]|uniref:uncharacterized protein LOC142950116 n=1 Tax=Anarhichas minor TaxID=65739 RepID=UPI003F739CDF
MPTPTPERYSTSSPVSIFTPAPPLPWHMLPPSPSPTILPSPPSPSPGDSETTGEVGCPLTLSPPTLVVRFGDPVTANCSLSRTGFSQLGWVVSRADPDLTTDRFQVWRVDSMTDWSIRPTCFVLSEQGPCDIHLPLTVYKPPRSVSISFVDPTGPMFEGQQNTLQCTVEDVAPVENLTVTFYRGRTVLSQQQSNINDTEKKPLTDIFSLNITLSKEDDGVQYWCEAKLELGPDGPQLPPVVTSQNITTTVYCEFVSFLPRKAFTHRGV